MMMALFCLLVPFVESYTTISPRSCSAECRININVEIGELCCPSPTSSPTTRPTSRPTRQPTISQNPTFIPSSRPTLRPTISQKPTRKPSNQPTIRPSSTPSSRPTSFPTITYLPTISPTSRPTPPRVLRSLTQLDAKAAASPVYSNQDPYLFDLFTYVYVHGLKETHLNGSCLASCEINEVITTVCEKTLSYIVEEGTVKKLNCLSVACNSTHSNTTISQTVRASCVRNVEVYANKPGGDDDELPGWAIALIVIFCICLCCGAGAGTQGKLVAVVYVYE
jgi:hypothetical protein